MDKTSNIRWIQRGRYLSGVSGVDDSIIPESSTGIKGVALLLVLGQNRLLERSLLLGRPGVACSIQGNTDENINKKAA